MKQILQTLLIVLSTLFCLLSITAESSADTADTTVVYQGLLHKRLGAADLANQGDTTLIVGNIGSSGNDGVSIDLGDSLSSFFVGLDPIDTSVSIGSYIRFTRIGTINNVSGQNLGSLQITKIGSGNYQIMPDFSSLGSSTYTIQVFLNDSLVTSSSGHSGADLMAPMWPWDDLWEKVRGALEDWLFDNLTWTSPIPFSVSGGPPVVGDKIKIMPDNPLPSSTFPTLTKIQAKNIPVLNMKKQRVARGKKTIGMLHNSAFDYYFAHDPFTDDKVRFTQSDIRAIFNVASDFVRTTQEDTSILSSLQDRFIQTYTKHNMFYIDSSETYFGYPVVNDSIVAYTTGYLLTNGYITPKLASEINNLNERILDRENESSIITYVTDTLVNLNWSPVEYYFVSVFADMFKHSAEYWQVNLPFTQQRGNTPLKRPPSFLDIVVHDSFGALGGALGGPAGVFLGSFVTSGLKVYDNHSSRFQLSQPLGDVTYKTLSTMAIGSAYLDVKDRKLEVHNIGSSGNDGVSVNIQGVHHFSTTFEPITPDSDALLPQLKISATGSINGGPVQDLGNISFVKFVGAIDINPDYSAAGSNTVRLMVFQNDSLVGEFTGFSGEIRTTQWPSGCGKESTTEPIIWCYRGDWPENVEFTINTGGPDIILEGNILRILSENSAELSNLSTFDITASDIPILVISDMSVADVTYTFGWEHRSLGLATLTELTDTLLIVKNLGGISGLDGVRISPPPTLTFDADFSPSYPASSLTTGSFLKFSARGKYSGGSIGQVGSMAFTDNGSGIEITVDYTPIGATLHTVQAFNGDSLVYSGSAFGSIIGTTDRTPEDIHWKHHPIITKGLRSSSTSMIQHGCTGTWKDPTPIDILNGGSIFATKLVVSPQDDTASVDFFTDFDITGGGLDSMVIWDEYIDRVIRRPRKFADGWNMASIPNIPVTYLKNVLFPTATSSAFFYSNGYQIGDTMKNGIGYWLEFSGEQTIDLDGDGILLDTIPVNTGWNMIGSISDSVTTSSIIPVGTSVSSSYFRYSTGYQTATSIQPAQGYWVKVSSNGSLVLNSSFASSKQVTGLKNELESLNSVAISDNKGMKQLLYFGKQPSKEFDIAKYEMPPVPPSGLFDARFSSQRLVELLPEDLSKSPEYRVNLSSVQFPLKVHLDMQKNNREKVTVLGLVDGTPISIQKLSANGTIKFDNPKINSLLIRVEQSSGVPTVFALHQNYPNPFNPSALIMFDVPLASMTTLKVYDVLGREVATLIDNSILEPGTHSYQFDGSNLSSGLYFYRLIAQSTERMFTDVKKMLLIK